MYTTTPTITTNNNKKKPTTRMLILSDNYYVRTVFIIVIYNLLTLQRDNNAPQNQRQALWQDQGRSSKLYCGPVIDIQSTVSLL